MLLQPIKKGRAVFSRFSRRTRSFAADESLLGALEETSPTEGDAFLLHSGNVEVVALRGARARSLRLDELDLSSGFTLDDDLSGAPARWNATAALPRDLAPLLEDRKLRLQIERAVAAGQAKLQGWGATGQRLLIGAVAELSTAMSVAAVAGASLDARAQEELAAIYLAWRRDAAKSGPLPFSSTLTGVVGRIEDHAPLWLKRPAARARATLLLLLREAINQGARRSRETRTSARESDLLRLAREPRRGEGDVEDAAELLLLLLEHTQRRAQHDCVALLQQLANDGTELAELLEEQDWVFGDQGDITYETLRPLERLRLATRQQAARRPQHLALLAPSARTLRLGSPPIEVGTPLLIGAPIPADPVEERLGEPLALALLSLLLREVELLPAAADLLRFRKRSL